MPETKSQVIEIGVIRHLRTCRHPQAANLFGDDFRWCSTCGAIKLSRDSAWQQPKWEDSLVGR